MKYEKIKQKIHEMYGHLPPFSRNNAAWGEIEREYLRGMIELGIPISTLALELKRSEGDVCHQAKVMNLQVPSPEPSPSRPQSPQAHVAAAPVTCPYIGGSGVLSQMGRMRNV